MRRYATPITHSDDYTLMAPFGGAPTRGFDDSSKRLAELARYFKAGTSELELVAARHAGLSPRRIRLAVGAPTR
jgi:hypothetical protein